MSGVCWPRGKGGGSLLCRFSVHSRPFLEIDNLDKQEKVLTAHPYVLQPMIPAMLATIATVLNCGDELAAQEALEMFIEVAEAHPRFLRHQLGEVLNAMLQVPPPYHPPPHIKATFRGRYFMQGAG